MARLFHHLFPKLFVVCVTVLAVRAGAAPNDWPAFRGGLAAGVSDQASPPTEWSSTTGIAWETSIPGRGCSSPIVQGNDVFVSTVYPSDWGAAVGTVIRNGVPIFCAALAMLGILSICNVLNAPNIASSVYLRISLLAIILLLLIFFAEYGRDAFNYDRSCHYRWLGSCLMVLASIVIFDFTKITRSSLDRLLGLCIMVLGASVFAFEPAMTQMLHGWEKLLKFPVCIPLAVAMGITSLGMLMYRGVVNFQIIRDEIQGEQTHRIAMLRRLLRVAGEVCLLLGGLVSAANFVVQSIPFLRERVGNITLQAEAGPWATWLLLASALAGLAMSIFFAGRLSVAPLFGGLRFCAAAIAIAIFVGNNLVLTQADGVRAIICMDAETGTIKWTCEALLGPIAETVERLTSQANPTCVADASRVIAYFGNAGVMCATRDGCLAWVNQEISSIDVYSAVSSPVLVGDIVIICSNQKDCFTTQGLDANTGKAIWKQQRPGGRKPQYNRRTPVLIGDADSHTDSQPVAAIWGPDFWAYRPQDGSVAWSYAISPAVLDYNRVASIAMDATTVVLACPEAIYAIDRETLDRGELSVRWVCREQGPDCSSPVVYHGMAFWVSEYGGTCCADELNGNILWQQQLDGQFYASIVAADNRVYFFNHEGTAYVVAAEPSFRLIASNHVPDIVLATPALSGNLLFIRGEHSLRCIGQPSPGEYIETAAK